MQHTTFKLTAADQHQFDCYQFIENLNPQVGFIVLHEIFGITKFIKNMCTLWALHGYHVVAPALYDRLEPHVAIPYTEQGYEQALAYKQKVLNWDQQLADIQATIDYLKQQGLSHIVVLGYSWGGTLSWLSACRLRNINRAISYYGTHIYQFKDEKPQCPCLLHFADQDDLVPQQHVTEIAQVHPSVEIITHPATHGFRCEDWQGGNDQAYNAKVSEQADHITKNWCDEQSYSF